MTQQEKKEHNQNLNSDEYIIPRRIRIWLEYPDPPIHRSAKITRFLFGITALIALILSIFFGSVTSDEEALEEIANRTSSLIESGFTLDEETDIKLEARNFDIGEFEESTTRMLIWDFTGDSKTEVQILVDGKVVREIHTLTSMVRAYTVPVPAEVTVEGLDEDANYAVKFPEQQYTIFNAVSPGVRNTYMLTPGL